MKLSNLVNKVISLLSISFISGGGISLIIGLTEKSQRNKNLSKFKKNDVEDNKKYLPKIFLLLLLLLRKLRKNNLQTLKIILLKIKLNYL
ncbi:hypothetical protein [Mycoplasma parvum]|uniref:Uncharacterized protein n=1 Tax=Mycoplasma parvum str. Indiana TaxID=1403316 RepID=U5NBZ8_9MOLU|nr:hypothetical protein [Mycoplasma parvum]AGX88825.1 hypothetical protein PRV_00200 [Mycoplasma parvum str. Indiana]